jgi:hypothetical protein
MLIYVLGIGVLQTDLFKPGGIPRYFSPVKVVVLIPQARANSHTMLATSRIYPLSCKKGATRMPIVGSPLAALRSM